MTSNLLRVEKTYCSYGDTVHYNNPPKIFLECEDSYMIDEEGVKYLDFQMAYSSANFGYKNRFFIEKLNEQLNTLPQIASEYLYPEKIILSQLINDSIELYRKVYK